jgi:hypothetical protein
VCNISCHILEHVTDAAAAMTYTASTRNTDAAATAIIAVLSAAAATATATVCCVVVVVIKYVSKYLLSVQQSIECDEHKRNQQSEVKIDTYKTAFT